MLRIALPNKGRLSDDARELFTDAGLEILAAGPRALTASLGGEFQALFVRAQDIPEFVADGAADAGVTGADLIRESGRTLDDLAARGKRYVMANVPRDRLAEVKLVVPGLNGPTIIDIMNGGTFVAVHAVVAAATIYRTIADLKALGAEGILVTRIERLMP